MKPSPTLKVRDGCNRFKSAANGKDEVLNVRNGLVSDKAVVVGKKEW